MVTEVAKRLINVEEYYKMAEVGILKPSDRVELIKGEIFEMSPIGSKHAGILNKLDDILRAALKGKANISVQSPIHLDNENEPEPDIAVLQFQEDYYVDSHPMPSDILTIIEIADSSLKYDRGIKLNLYASFDVPKYLIVNIDTGEIIVFTNPEGTKYLNQEVCSLEDEIEILGTSIKVEDIVIRPKS